MARLVRGVVSKKKKRFQEDSFDLDLSYIPTLPEHKVNVRLQDGRLAQRDRIIAMGFPSEGTEGLYRNPMSEVKKFFNLYHRGHFKIYNLCSERAYDLQAFATEADDHEICERFAFDDHNPCPLSMIKPFCESVDRWLNEHPENVAAIHCKAGKGRTGTMIAAYIVHCTTNSGGEAEDALATFSRARTNNNKGVTIPSQHRYVHYYARLLQWNGGPTTPDFRIPAHLYRMTHIRFITVPSFEGTMKADGCDPTFRLTQYRVDYNERGTKAYQDEGMYGMKDDRIFEYKRALGGMPLRHFKKEELYVDLDIEPFNLLVKGDSKLEFFSRDSKMFTVWFHTGFVNDNYLCFEKMVLDKACKDKEHYDTNFKVEIFMEKLEEGIDGAPRTFEMPHTLVDAGGGGGGGGAAGGAGAAGGGGGAAGGEGKADADGEGGVMVVSAAQNTSKSMLLKRPGSFRKAPKA